MTDFIKFRSDAQMITLVDKIVSSNVNGTILILPLIVLLWAFVGQAKDCVRVVKKVLREGQKSTSN